MDIRELDLSAAEIERIVGFMGYGTPGADVWFIGIEEGLGSMDSDDAIKNLKARAKFDSVMDLYQAHLQLREIGAQLDFERKVPATQVWKFMAKIMLAREREDDWASTVAANDYIRTRLGRSDGNTFMTELSPIPASHGADKRWVEKLKQMDQNLGEQISKRRENLKELLNDNSPRLVICYGHSKARDFAELLGVKWELIGQSVYKSADSKCLLLPFFGQGHMSRFFIDDLLQAGLLD